MTDIENEIFDGAAKALEERFLKIFLLSELVLSPSEFPCVCIEEADNFSYDPTADSSGNENHAKLMYEVNVYSNKISGKKSECKAILAVIDEYFTGLGFARKTKTPIPTGDATQYRLFARYEAVASKDKVIYRR